MQVEFQYKKWYSRISTTIPFSALLQAPEAGLLLI